MTRRQQKGSLQKRRHDKWVWVVLYRDASGSRRYHTLGAVASMTKGQAERAQAEFMAGINRRLCGVGVSAAGGAPRMTLAAFIEQRFLPHYRQRWKASTAATAESRIRHHLVRGPISGLGMADARLCDLQEFLNERASAGRSFSTVDHLRWDLRSIWELAVAEQVVASDPTAPLYTPTVCPRSAGRVLSVEQVEQVLEVLDPRERVIVQLAVFGGFRPGEILALQRRHVGGPSCSSVTVEQRVYRGGLATPKTNRSARVVAVPPRTAALLRWWLVNCVRPRPEAYLFASETGTPLWRDNLLRRYIQPKLMPLGLDWVDFQVMRRSNASLGHAAGADPKAAADQRGHGLGVSMEVYTQVPLAVRAEQAELLEQAVLSKLVN